MSNLINAIEGKLHPATAVDAQENEAMQAEVGVIAEEMPLVDPVGNKEMDLNELNTEYLSNG